MNGKVHNLEDKFWKADLNTIEATFLGTRKITDLKICLDDRVPAQDCTQLSRIVDVDKTVSDFLASTLKK